MMKSNPEAMLENFKLLSRYSQVDDQHPSFQFSSGANTRVNPLVGPGFHNFGIGVEDSMASRKPRYAPQPNEVPTCSFMAFGAEPAHALVQGLQEEMLKKQFQLQKEQHEAQEKFNREMLSLQQSLQQQQHQVERSSNSMANHLPAHLGLERGLFTRMTKDPRRPQASETELRGPPGLVAEGAGMWTQSSQSNIQMQFYDNADYDESDDEDEAEYWHPSTPVQRLKDQQRGGPKTTLMVRNIPVMYTQEMLLMEWPNNNTYDFLYLPFSVSAQRNLTYAFINFTTPAAACEFKKKWQKTRLYHYMARKPLNISFADLQGRDENLLQLKKKRFWRIKIKQCQPIIFEKGERISLAQALHNLECSDAHAFGSRVGF